MIFKSCLIGRKLSEFRPKSTKGGVGAESHYLKVVPVKRRIGCLKNVRTRIVRTKNVSIIEISIVCSHMEKSQGGSV